MGKVMYGTISYIPPDSAMKSARIVNHRKQLDWLSTLLTKDDLYYRVESAWGDDSDYDCLYDVPFEITSMPVPPAYPGANRNFLLKELYESDYDWLVIMDDDRALYPYFNGSLFFTKDLKGPDGDRLAREGTLIEAMSPVAEPFKKQCSSFERRREAWFFSRSCIMGFLQIACIPNLVKYGYEPVYMNGATDCQAGSPPEDLQFELDWVLAKHGLACNKNLIVKEFGGDRQSTLYPNKEHRRMVEASHREWVAGYLKSKNPKIKALWSKRGLNARRNKFDPNQLFLRRGVMWEDAWDDIAPKKRATHSLSEASPEAD